MTENWRTPVDAAGYFAQRKKRDEIDQRRPAARKMSDLPDAGPGLRGEAVRVTEWNDMLALYDGFYSSAGDAGHVPYAGEDWTGVVVNDGGFGGTQTLTGMVSGNTYRRIFTRAVRDARAVEFTKWFITTGVLLLENGQTMEAWFTANPNLDVPVGTVVFEKQA